MNLKERIRNEMVGRHRRPQKPLQLKREPIDIDKHNWYYEEKKGICFVHEVIDKGQNYLQTDQFMVLWRTLSASMKRKYEGRRWGKSK